MFNSLKNKVILSIIITIVLCAAVTSLVVTITVRFQMSGQYAAEKEAAIESLSVSLTKIIAAGDLDQIGRTLESALVYENVASVSVFDPMGKLLGTASDQGVNPAELELSRHSLTVNGQTIGSFEAGLSNSYINNLARDTVIALVSVLVAFLFLAGLALYIFLRRSVLQPVAAVTKTVRQISPKNLSPRVNIGTRDEIGFLGEAFNQMTDNLERSQKELLQSYDKLEETVEIRTRGERRRAEQLRAINEVGRRISSILSLEELLPYVVNSIQQTFDYYNVNIFLVNAATGAIELRTGAGGYVAGQQADVSINKGEGLVGLAVSTGQSLICDNVNQEPSFINSPDLPETLSEMVVPIKLGTEILGALDIQSNELNAFDEIDLFTAETLADQLAIAIENSRLYRETREMAVISERNRIAREIHDTLAQGFTGIVLQLEAAEETLLTEPSVSRDHLDRARQLARNSLNEARRSVWSLRPQELEQRTLPETLQAEAEKFSRDTGISTTFYVSGKVKQLNQDTENGLLRIFQQAINNIEQHAKASEIKIDLSFNDDNIQLTMGDNGAGFETDKIEAGRFGLIGMRERTRLLGGSLEISSQPGQGTQVTATIPL